MKKLLVLVMALAMTLSLAACGGKAAPAAAPSTPVQVEEVEFTAEQQALAQDFMSMAEEFDAIADKVNASPELLENEELVTAMNDLSSEIIKADEYFASPETLTPEVMGALTVAIEVGRSFIAEAGAALDEVSQ
jgi:predicted small lipoprotein YifL